MKQTDLFQTALRVAPMRKRGSPGPSAHELAGREEALDRLAETRAKLIAVAQDVAREIVIQRGRVTSVEVFATLRAQGYDEALDACDPRWMGCVFRRSGWVRLKWETTGSHRRPVAVWGLSADEG